MIVHSKSLNNAFITTVDHLPCDVTRSLWLVQSCNLALNKHREELDDILKRIQKGETQNEYGDTVNRILELKREIHKLSGESIQETRALYNQLITHQLTLKDELNQLHSLLGSRQSMSEQDESKEQEDLRNQLKEYYGEHPLVSQKEAFQEEKSVNSLKKIVKSKPSGLRLILKLTKNGPKGKKSRISKKDKKRTQKGFVNTTTTRKAVQKPVVDVTNAKALPSHETTVTEEDNNLYCFCKQPSSGDMIGCDNEKSCPNGDWFHYKCVGLLNRVDALKYTTGKEKWFCSDYCREAVMKRQKRKKKKRW